MSMTTATAFKIDPEIRKLIPSLSDEERTGLEASLIAEGCRDALVVWEGTLLDGHNRHDICKRRGINFETTEVDLPDRNAAMAWVIRNQLARRNLNDYQRSQLALELEPLIAEKARQQQGKRTDLPKNSAEGFKPVETRQEVAKAANVSHDTIRKVKETEEKAVGPIKSLARNGHVSVNAAHIVSALPPKEQEAVAARGPEAVKEKAKEVRAEKATEPPTDDPELWAKRWNSRLQKLCEDMNLLLVSLPRRGGFGNLVKKWSKKNVEVAVQYLKDLRDVCDKGIAELEERLK
jgi:hypothetical protein